MAGTLFQEPGAQHGRECEGYEQGNCYRDRDCQPILIKEATDDSTHEGNWEKYGHHRQGRGDDCCSYISCSPRCRLLDVNTSLYLSVNRLEHNDGIVDKQSNREGDGNHRDHVDGEIQHIESKKSRNDCSGNRGSDNQCRTGAEKKHQRDQNDQGNPQNNVDRNISDG